MKEPINDSFTFANVKKVRTISNSSHSGCHSREDETNECIKLGWILLAVHPEEFVVGWTHLEKPPLTNYQKEIESL